MPLIRDSPVQHNRKPGTSRRSEGTVVSRTLNDVPLLSRPRERIHLQDDTDESPEDSFESLLVAFGVSGLLILSLVVCVLLLVILS